MSEAADSIKETVRSRVIEWGRGRIFFAQDFAYLDAPENVRQALCALTNEGYIHRLARGIYCFPRMVGENSMKTILPTNDTIAEAVAQKARIRIVPEGQQAAYLTGLTSVQLSKYTWLTDGAPRKISLGKQGTIIFEHTSEMRIFSFENETIQLLSLAIRALGLENIGEFEKHIIKNKLAPIPEKVIQKELNLCPAWVQDVIISAREG